METKFCLSKEIEINHGGMEVVRIEKLKEFIELLKETECPICKKEEPCRHTSQIEDLMNKKWIKKINKITGDKLKGDKDNY